MDALQHSADATGVSRRLDRLATRYDWGLLTADEYVDEVAAMILAASPLVEMRAHWLAELMRQHGHTPPQVLRLACGLVPCGVSDDLDDLLLRAIEKVTTPGDLKDPYQGAFVCAWLPRAGDVIFPATLYAATEDPAPLSYAAWAAYLIATSGGDHAGAEVIIKKDIAAGCPSSAIRTGSPAIHTITARSLADAGRYGDMVNLAIYHLTQGNHSRAAEISDQVDNNRLADPTEVRPALNHAPPVAPPYRCHISDFSLLAPLALIDYLTGSHAHAKQRAVQYVNASDTFERGWDLAGHDAVAEWVLAMTTANPSVRLGYLDSAGDQRHTWLGLLGAQIHSDRADTLDALGDHTSSAHARDAAIQSMRYPEVLLHYGQFDYDTLLTALPFPASVAAGSPG